MVCHPHLLPQSSTNMMVCHPHVLPQSSTSTSLIRPTIPTNRSLDLLPQTTDLPQTTHIQPLQPKNGPPFVVGFINPIATNNPPYPPCPPYPQTHKHKTEVELLPHTTHMQPLQPRNGAPFAVGLIRPMAHQLCRLTIHPTQPIETGPKVSNKQI